MILDEMTSLEVLNAKTVISELSSFGTVDTIGFSAGDPSSNPVLRKESLKFNEKKFHSEIVHIFSFQFCKKI